MNYEHLFFIHGLEGSSQGVKATILRDRFPGVNIPDFTGTLENRMAQLEDHLSVRDDWYLIGSSLGGLMAAMYVCKNEEQISRLLLFAPALIWPEFISQPRDSVQVPTIIYHGRRDVTIPLDLARPIAEKVFVNLDLRIVDDDHGLHKTVNSIDWESLIDM
jgi:pimeloyl-ACP methyl ester carboxylesterase